jgi:protein-disulfide isomerase
MHNLFCLAILIFLCSCSEKIDYSTPAQVHIDEYTAKLKLCQEDKAKGISTPEKSEAPKIENPTVPKDTPTKVPTMFDIKQTDMVFGDKSSKVVIIEYFSLTCPHCAYFHQKIFPSIKKKYIDTNKIAYVIREFVGNKQDLDGSILARCDGSKDKFMQFVSVLLEKQDTWAFNKQYRDHLIKMGELGGIPKDKFNSCLEADTIPTLLIENAKEISKLPKFIGTPTFFINGVQYTNAYTLDSLSKSIDAAIDVAK